MPTRNNLFIMINTSLNFCFPIPQAARCVALSLSLSIVSSSSQAFQAPSRTTAPGNIPLLRLLLPNTLMDLDHRTLGSTGSFLSSVLPSPNPNYSGLLRPVHSSCWIRTLCIGYIICIRYSVNTNCKLGFCCSVHATSTACLSILGEGSLLCGSSWATDGSAVPFLLHFPCECAVAELTSCLPLKTVTVATSAYSDITGVPFMTVLRDQHSSGCSYLPTPCLHLLGSLILQ